MDFILFWLGGVYTALLITGAAQLATRKITRKQFAVGAAIGAAGSVALGLLLHIILSLVEQNGFGWLLAVIGFLFALFVLCSALVGGILRLLYRD